jgi:hypothetical protein
MSNQSRLKERFVMAIDEVIPPAPWLEHRVIEVIRQIRLDKRRRLWVNGPADLRPSLRIVAGVAAALIAVAAMAALLMSAHLRTSPSPARPTPALTSPSPNPSEAPWNPSSSAFTPTTVRDPSWPPGGPVPANLAGAWQPQVHNAKTGVLYLGGYSFQIQVIVGNVVVNGSEIDFIYDPCGVDKYRYTLTGDTLVLVRITNVCNIQIPGTYTRLAQP